jgi:predicted ATPase
VSQALPVLVELLDRKHGSWFAIQQPEVHLHPRAQAALGDVFFEMATSEHKRLLVETHSDFTIDRFRINYRKSKDRKPESQILFFERRDKHNTVTALPIDDTGELPEDQPSSYRDFFVGEELRLLGDNTI